MKRRKHVVVTVPLSVWAEFFTAWGFGGIGIHFKPRSEKLRKKGKR